MMNAKTVYIVHSPSYNDTTVIYGVFDLKERLDNFLDRFKDRIDDVEIKEMPLNPTFPGDKTRNPYCATLFRDGTAMLHIISNPTDSDRRSEERRVGKEHRARLSGSCDGR